MAKHALIGGITAIVVGGVAAAFYFTGGGGSGDLDAAGQRLLERFAAEVGGSAAGTSSDTSSGASSGTDADTRRALLKDLLAHPDSDSHRGLLRAQAWLYQELGNSLRAWEALHGNLGVGVEPADLRLGARILQARHAETGDRDQADQALSCARLHFEATGDLGSLFLAWQMALRLDDRERAAEFSKILAEHPDNRYGRVVMALPNFPVEVDQSDGARAKFLALLDEFDAPPAELSLALAWWEVCRAEHQLSAQRRAEAVLRSFRVSRTARLLIATAALGLERYSLAKSHLEWLLKTYPRDRIARKWRLLLEYADAELAKSRTGK